MHRRLLILLPCLCLSIWLAACGQPSALTSQETLQVEPTVVQRTLIPERMPTAAPLWTAVPAVVPSRPAQVAIKEPDTAIVATVDGAPILRSDLARRLLEARIQLLRQPGVDARDAATQEALVALEDQVLGWMIDQELIASAARAQGVTIAEDRVDAEIARMRDANPSQFRDWLSSNGLTEESLREQIRADLLTAAVRDKITDTMPRHMHQIHVRHILTADERTAAEVLRQVRGGRDFAELAREVSEDETTRDNGGDLGFLPRGVMPTTFEDAAFGLAVGAISDVVQSEFGFHVLKVLEIDVNRQISDELWPMVQQQAFEHWLTEQRSKATILYSPRQ